MKNTYYLIILIVVSSISHFIFYGQPAQTVFDETYFVRYASDYLTGSYYFDLHPPLGKMLISATAQVAGGSVDNTDYSSIGNNFANSNYLWYRLLPTLAGTFLPAIIFLLALELGMSALAAFLAGLLVIFENSLLVQSRMTSLDSLLLLCGFISILAYFRYRKKRNSSQKSSGYYLILSAIAATMAFSLKWTGLAFLGMILLLELFDLVREKLTYVRIKKFSGVIAVFLSIGFALYFSVFAIHFALLTKSGQGDAFMSPSFQKTLTGNNYENDQTLTAPNLWSKFTELNKEMYVLNETMTATHQYSSQWYTWPIMERSIFYWQELSSGKYIYYLGNPFIYWLGAVSISILALYLLALFLKKKTLLYNSHKWNIAAFIIVGYAANFLPFAFIERPMFLYHYEVALVLSIIAIAWLVDGIRSEKWKVGAVIAILVLGISSFIYFSPLTYGLHLDQSQLQARMWLSSWR